MTRFPRHLPGVAIVAMLACMGAAHASPAPTPPVSVTHGWFTTMANNGPTYGYFDVTNNGNEPQLISGYTAPGCTSLKLEEAHSGGVDAKSPVAMTLPPHRKLVFVRDGYHLVCGRPTDAIKVGQTVPVTITLQSGQTLHAAFDVRTPPNH